ncbi:hypothetical protein [Luteibacter yeojuensis]|nr:hypothetical protein [Luteibacter yeojuensis]
MDHTAVALACLGAVVLGYLWEQRNQTALAVRASLLVEHQRRES